MVNKEEKKLKTLNYFNDTIDISTNNSEKINECDLLLSKEPLGNDLNLTLVVNEMFSLDIRTPT